MKSVVVNYSSSATFLSDFESKSKIISDEMTLNNGNFVTLIPTSGEQMLSTRRSDELFYDEITDPMEKQIIDNYTGVKLICDTTKLVSVPQNIFHVPSEKYENHTIKHHQMHANTFYFFNFECYLPGILWCTVRTNGRTRKRTP